MRTTRQQKTAVLLSLLLALSLFTLAPGVAGAEEHSDATVAFKDVPGEVRAGRTVPVRFSVSDSVGPVTAEVTGPEGATAELDVRRQGPRDRYQAQVRTERGLPGQYTVVVKDDGVEVGAQSFTAELPPGQVPDVPEVTEVTLLHDTHFHGTFGDPDGANVARYMALASELKQEHEHALFVGNGDDIAPSLHSGVFRGVHMIDVLNASPLDVNTFGNHEFDYGPDQLRTLVEQSEFPWVTANVRDIDTGEPFAADLGVERFVTTEFDDVTVGVTGLGPEGMATITSLGDETEQIPAVEAMEEVVPQMQDAGVDVVVVASHLGSDDARNLAAEVDGIDAIVGDHHAAVLEEPEVINDTIVSFVGDEFDYLGELTLEIVDGGVVDHSFTLHEVTDAIDPDPTVQAIVDDYDAQLDEELNVVIGERTVDWVTTRSVVRNEETGIGNFIADSMREFHDADIAVQNSGGIRADTVFPAGDITRREVAEILPFDNYVVKAEIEGWVIEEMLEHSVSDFPDSDGRFLQVSGIEMEFDATREVGDRVTDFSLNGEEVDPDATYTVATNDFTLGGGDAYDMLAEHATVIVDAAGGPLLSAFIIETIEDMTEAGETVDTDIEGRIIRLDD